MSKQTLAETKQYIKEMTVKYEEKIFNCNKKEAWKKSWYHGVIYGIKHIRSFMRNTEKMKKIREGKK